MPTVLLIGTLDTKGDELALRRRSGCATRASTCSSPTPGRPGRRTGSSPTSPRRSSRPRSARTSPRSTDRGTAVGTMADAAAALARAAARRGPDRRRARRRRLGQHGDRDGGDAGAARRRAEADGLDDGRGRHRATTSAASDVTMMASVTDVAGLNSISARILANAAAAMAGDGRRAAGRAGRDAAADRRDDVRRHDAVRDARARGSSRRAATRCSCSTRPAPAARRWRRSSTRASSPACSTRRRPSCATTSSAACSPPGPTGSRRRARAGLPQVVSLGALDMVNFGARDTVPPQFEDRNLYVHNPSITLMRTTRGGVRGARPPDRAQAVRGDRAGRAVRPARRRLDDRRRRASRSTTPRPTRRCSTRCAPGSATNVELVELRLQRQRRGVRRRDGREAGRLREGERMTGTRRARSCARRSTAAA